MPLFPHPANAADRAGGGLSAAEHEQAGGRAQGLSLSARWAVYRSGQPGLVLGHHLYPDGQGVHVSGRYHGLAQSCGTGLAAVEHARRRFLRRGARGSARSLWSAGDLQHRPEPAPAKAGGSQFTSDDFTGVLSRHEVTISMDGKGRCMDNVFIERLWRSLKYEEVYLHAYGTVAAAKAGIGAWLVFYNEERQHQSHGYRTPRQVYEAQSGGDVDDRLCRPAALPPLPEPARKAGKCSPSPTSPPAQPPTQGLIKRALAVE